MPRSSATWTKETVPKSPGAPKGPRLPSDVLKLKDAAKAEVIRCISSGLLMSIGDLKKLMEKASWKAGNPQFDPETPVVDVLVASVLAQAIQHGDMKRFTYLANFIIGKPKPLEMSDDQDDPANSGNILRQLPSSVLIEAIRKRASEQASEET